MKSLLASAFLCVATGVALAQPVTMEPPDFPQVQPGPVIAYTGTECFLAAQGQIVPGDVDWIRVRLPRASSRTVIDVDFPTGASGSALLAMVANGTTGFNIADNNNARDALCGMNAASAPQGSTRDSVVDVRETSINAVIDIAVTGAADTSFVGLHNESFSYELWVYALPYPCVNDLGCNDGIACTLDQCNIATGDCANTPQDTACDDEFFCNGVEWCDASLGCRTPGMPACDDGVDCTDDYCDFGTDSCANDVWDEFCDNVIFCDGQEWCHPTQGCQAGEPVDCNDGVACTMDACDDGLEECIHSVGDNACDDGLFCNGMESCDESGCVAGVLPCGDGPCRESDDRCVECVADADCDDTVYCNGEELCNALGECEEGGQPCGDLFCRESDDRCVECLADADCADGDYCNGSEMCGADSSCEDGDYPCGSDLCREDDDQCVQCLSDADCSDEDFCNGVEQCNSSGVCMAGTYPCGNDQCDEVADACAECLADTDCNDGVYCDGSEFCDANGRCAEGAEPCEGSFCREADDQCVECLADADCADADFCNGVERCDASGACSSGSAPCGEAMCDEDMDACVECMSDADCDDGLYCNGAEFCDPDGSCASGAEPCESLCREGDDKCVECLSDAACDDGLFCNGSESCGAAGQCVDSTAPCAAGQTCDEKSDHCLSAPFSANINPGACPARVVTSARGNLSVAIVGGSVGMIDPRSVRLSRADGVGQPVAVVMAPAGQAPRFDDVSGPNEACSCPDVGMDGFDDLVVSFKVNDVVRAFQLDKVGRKLSVELTVTGKLLDGTTFSANDCVTVQTTGNPHAAD